MRINFIDSIPFINIINKLNYIKYISDLEQLEANILKLTMNFTKNNITII